MTYPQIDFDRCLGMELDTFKQMDYYAVTNFNLPIELMMENAGLQLANLVANEATKDQSIKVGVGNGNNGGGGLVAARRLAAWGYQVHLEFFTKISQPLARLQLQRALKFGAAIDAIKDPDIWIDAYLGFSQRLP